MYAQETKAKRQITRNPQKTQSSKANIKTEPQKQLPEPIEAKRQKVVDKEKERPDRAGRP